MPVQKLTMWAAHHNTHAEEVVIRNATAAFLRSVRAIVDVMVLYNLVWHKTRETFESLCHLGYQKQVGSVMLFVDPVLIFRYQIKTSDVGYHHIPAEEDGH